MLQLFLHWRPCLLVSILEQYGGAPSVPRSCSYSPTWSQECIAVVGAVWCTCKCRLKCCWVHFPKIVALCQPSHKGDGRNGWRTQRTEEKKKKNTRGIPKAADRADVNEPIFYRSTYECPPPRELHRWHLCMYRRWTGSRCSPNIPKGTPGTPVSCEKLPSAVLIRNLLCLRS
jgi:hypothetical protein